MLIRAEAPNDILPIDRLLKKVFAHCDRASFVMSLRENGYNTLSLVACDDEGALFAHLMFSSVTINGIDIGVQKLASIAVHPLYDNLLISKKLILEGFEILQDFGYPACVVLGCSHFYSSLGFRLARPFGLDLQDEGLEQNSSFMAIELTDGALDLCQGKVDYFAELNVLEQEGMQKNALSMNDYA